MRLLNTDTLQLHQFGDDEIPTYAILSHTWLDEEITFQDLGQSYAPARQGYAKLDNFCSKARFDGYQYAWIDTCCIDKTSSAELSEAINSMYYWYQTAAVCYTYLADVSTLHDFSNSRWFTRGWTLQELIAPSRMIFFNEIWLELGTKEELEAEIVGCTGIPRGIISGKDPLETASIAQRMSWAAHRKTTRIEDRAYCLMGIFGINMPLIYGEREKSFIRLQEEIMRASNDQSLFVWTYPDTCGGLLAPAPEAFKGSGRIIALNSLASYGSPVTVTNNGAHMELTFVALRQAGIGIAFLNCTEIGNEDCRVSITLRDVFLTMEHFERCWTTTLELSNLSRYTSSQSRTRSLCISLRGRPGQDKRDGSQTQLSLTSLSLVSTTKQLWNEQWKLDAIKGVIEEDVVDPGLRRKMLQAAANVPGYSHRILTKYLKKLSEGEGDRALARAAAKGQDGPIRLLLALPNIDINWADESGYTPLLHAAANGHSGTVWLLLARNDIKARAEDNEGRTIFSHAAARGHEALLRQLLTRKDTQSFRYRPDGMGRSAISYAAENGHESVVMMMLGRETFDVDRKDSKGRSALWYAVGGNNETIIQLLLETERVDLEGTCEDGKTALYRAIESGLEKTALRLLSHGAKVNTKASDGSTLLHKASGRGYSEIAFQLLSRNAAVEERDNDGATPLHWAAWKGQENMVRMLMSKGASVDATTLDGESPLWYACCGGFTNVVQLLIHGGATTVDDRNRIIGLEIAAARGHNKIAAILLGRCRDKNSAAESIRRALSEARNHGHEDTYRVLKELTANVKALEGFEP